MCNRAPPQGEYVLVLDCDMIVHPDFLQCTVGHFYTLGGEQGKWVPKEKAAFLQTAQVGLMCTQLGPGI